MARSDYIASVASNHSSAETGGISGLPGLAPTGNVTNWSRAAAKAELVAGRLTTAQFVTVMQQISSWEQAQNDSAFATLRNAAPDPLPR